MILCVFVTFGFWGNWSQFFTRRKIRRRRLQREVREGKKGWEMRGLQLPLTQTQKVRLQRALEKLEALSSKANSNASVTVADTIPVNYDDGFLKYWCRPDLVFILVYLISDFTWCNFVYDICSFMFPVLLSSPSLRRAWCYKFWNLSQHFVVLSLQYMHD